MTTSPKLDRTRWYGQIRRIGRRRDRRRLHMGAAVVCALMLAGCSGGNGGNGGGFLGFGGDGGTELMSTDLGQGYVDGATTTIVAPPGWEGDVGEAKDDSSDGEKKDDDDNGGLFGFGRDKKPDLSHLTPESVPDLCSEPQCSVDWRDIDHPTWGPTRVFLPSFNDYDPTNFGALGMSAVDASGEVKWQYALLTGGGDPSFVTEEPDAGEALYIDDNLDGIIVLRPTEDGFGPLPDGGLMGQGLDDENSYFSSATIGELDDDGNYTIIVEKPDTHTMIWDGSKYVEK